MSAAPSPSRIFVTGASGLLGARLIDDLVRDGVEVVALSRRSQRDERESVHWVEGDVTEPGAWMAELDGCSQIVHLAGESVAGGRWTRARKKLLTASRVDGARHLVRAISEAGDPPGQIVTASAVGFYGPGGERELDEDASPGDDFLARLCVAWEGAFGAAEVAGTQVVALRLGVVLSRSGGALAKMLPAFRFGVGGPLGPGDRFFPWVHEADALGLLRFALARGPELAGPINAVAPGVVRMREFARALGRALGRPAILPVPLPALRLALGEAAEGLVPGQRVVPRRALEQGYRFEYPELEKALAQLLA